MYIIKITNENAADFEGLAPHQMLIEPEVFGVGCLNDDREIIGASILDTDGFSLIIRSVFVAPDSREQGAGRMMIEGIAEMARVAGLYSVEAYLANEDLTDFFSDNSFMIIPGLPLYELDFEDILKSPIIRKLKAQGTNCMSLSSLKSSEKFALAEILRKADYRETIESHDQDLSYVYIDGGKPVGCLLLTYDGDRRSVVVNYMLNTDRKNPRVIAEILAAEANAVRRNKIKVDSVVFTETGSGISSTVKKMIEGVEGRGLRRTGYTSRAVLAVEEQD